jgi:hypothetical protein
MGKKKGKKRVKNQPTHDDGHGGTVELAMLDRGRQMRREWQPEAAATGEFLP